MQDVIYLAAKDTAIFWGRKVNAYGRYCAEGELVRRLNARRCPNVVKVYDWAPVIPPSEISHRIIFEYYPNGDLYALAKFYARRR